MARNAEIIRTADICDYVGDDVLICQLALNDLDVVLNDSQRERLDSAFYPGVTAGSRYPEKQMVTLGI